MPIPLPGDYPDFCQPYIMLAQGDDFDTLCRNAEDDMQSILHIPFSKANYRYAPDKWTVNEVLQHLVDTERIYSYRALALARGEKASLLPVDELQYTAASEANERSLSSLLDEFRAARISTDHLFRNFSPRQLAQRGRVGADAYTVNSLGYYVYGHLHHHLLVLQYRYGL